MWRARQDGRARDRTILSALLREVNVISGLAKSIVTDVGREQELLQQGRLRIKPLVTLPTTAHDLVKGHAPRALLAHDTALLDLIRLQAQCAYTNLLAAEQQKWKGPAARGQEDQFETIASFQPAIIESVTTVVERCDRLAPALRAAGEKVGGLNLQGPPARQRT